MKKVNFECMNENCIYHNEDNSCVKDTIRLGKQGVCTR